MWHPWLNHQYQWILENSSLWSINKKVSKWPLFSIYSSITHQNTIILFQLILYFFKLLEHYQLENHISSSIRTPYQIKWQSITIYPLANIHNPNLSMFQHSIHYLLVRIKRRSSFSFEDKQIHYYYYFATLSPCVA